MVRHDRLQSPTDAALEARLGTSFAAFRALIGTYPELQPEWKWYGEKHGWSLKLLDGKRNVCFLSPDDGRFHVGFTFGHDAVQRALESDEIPVPIRQVIAGARTYAEGRPFRLAIESEEQLEPVHPLIRIKRAGHPATSRHGGNRAARRAGADASTGPGPARAPRVPRQAHTAPSHRRGRSPG